MVLRTIDTDPDILRQAINDGINRYLRDVLLPSGLVDEERFECAEPELNMTRRKVVEATVKSWQQSQFDDEA